jgi:hypothetical protein
MLKTSQNLSKPLKTSQNLSKPLKTSQKVSKTGIEVRHAGAVMFPQKILKPLKTLKRNQHQVWRCAIRRCDAPLKNFKTSQKPLKRLQN